MTPQDTQLLHSISPDLSPDFIAGWEHACNYKDAEHTADLSRICEHTNHEFINVEALMNNRDKWKRIASILADQFGVTIEDVGFEDLVSRHEVINRIYCHPRPHVDENPGITQFVIGLVQQMESIGRYDRQ